VRELGAAGGIMITSSHNPAQWNGVKYKAWYGGSGSPSIIAEIETYLGQPVARPAQPAAITEVDFLPTYLKGIESFTSLDKLASSGMKFAIDSMYGAGGTYIADIFTRLGVDHVQIRSNPDPLFPGINPEPIEPNIRALGVASVEYGCQAGLSIPTRFFPCCSVGRSSTITTGPAQLPAPSTPPKCSIASAKSMAANSSSTASASSTSATSCWSGTF
jgi:phosphomannomutase